MPNPATSAQQHRSWRQGGGKNGPPRARAGARWFASLLAVGLVGLFGWLVYRWWLERAPNTRFVAITTGDAHKFTVPPIPFAREDMAAFDTSNRARSAGPALYALEVNQGWFAERGIESGDRAEFTLPGDLVIE